MKKIAYFFLGAFTMLVLMVGYMFFFGQLFCLDRETLLPTVAEVGETPVTPPVVNVDGSKTINLSPAQEGMLDSFGVDPDSVSTTISPDQEACFREVIGDKRVDEILAGDTPSLLEMVKGKGCIDNQ